MPQDMPPVGGYGPVQYKAVRSKTARRESIRSMQGVNVPRVHGVDAPAKSDHDNQFLATATPAGHTGVAGLRDFEDLGLSGELSATANQLDMETTNLRRGEHWITLRVFTNSGSFSQRNLPASSFRPGTLILGMGAIMVYGFYKLGQGIREQNELAREKMWSRIHLIPLLQAEEDRDLVRRHLADQSREKELLGDNFKVYNSDRYVRPTYAVTPTTTK